MLGHDMVEQGNELGVGEAGQKGLFLEGLN
jgi:hypothetical protein